MGTFLPPQLGYHISGRTDRIVMKTLPEMCLYVSPLNFWKFSGSSFAEVCAFRVLLFSKFLFIKTETNKTCGNIAQHQHKYREFFKLRARSVESTKNSCSREVIKSSFMYQPCTDCNDFSLITNYLL